MGLVLSEGAPRPFDLGDKVGFDRHRNPREQNRGCRTRIRKVKISSARFVASVLFCASFLAAQPVDDTQLKQVIIFGRHSVRSPVAPNSLLNTFSAQPFPDFGVAAPGILTSNGATLETILGRYYRLWLTKEGLLTGNDSTDAAFVYFRANVLERTVATAKAFAFGMLPAVSVKR